MLHNYSGAQMMPSTYGTSVALGYLEAKLTVLRSPFGGEVISHAGISPDAISETDFLRETAWAILSCGMAESVVRKAFGPVSAAFLDWKSAIAISKEPEQCVHRAQLTFDHRLKLNAIVKVADHVSIRGFESCACSLRSDPMGFLTSFSYLGPASGKHAAKNLGFVFAKPDRHLLNLARLLGYESPDALCHEIAHLTGEPIRVIDLVLWRYCSMHKEGPLRFVRLVN